MQTGFYGIASGLQSGFYGADYAIVGRARRQPPPGRDVRTLARAGLLSDLIFVVLRDLPGGASLARAYGTDVGLQSGFYGIASGLQSGFYGADSLS
ncbi:hypothetical protein DF41_04745 [Raoultella planticola]|nr:hypothetical protein DF41_04745 [Raoultella planticola]